MTRLHRHCGPLKHKVFSSFLIILSCGFLVSCSSDGSKEVAALTPMLGTPRDPDDSQLMAATKAYIENQEGPAYSRFEYTRIDLNGDGLREGLVMFKGPHTYWCGWGGCTMAVFQAHEEGFSLTSTLNRIRGPLVVSESTSNGWKDLIVRISGTSMSDRNVAMGFDGRGYPLNPLTQTEIMASLSDIPGRKIFP